MTSPVSCVGMLMLSVGEENGKRTLGDLREFVQRCDLFGLPDSLVMDECYVSLAHLSGDLTAYRLPQDGGVDVVWTIPANAA